MRPKYLHNKTIFIEMEIEDFYSYKNFGKEFNESFYIDSENRYHTVPLYLVWGEKCSFLKRAILKNHRESPIAPKIFGISMLAKIFTNI